MADDRAIRVRLVADVQSYMQGMKQAASATSDFGREMTGAGKSSRADIEAVGRTALVASGALAFGFVKAGGVIMDFEKEMSGVRAVSGATAEEMDRLSQAALDAGASQELAGVTASDAAKAEAELVKAGVSVSDVLGGALMGSLTLASAGQLDFADAATIAAQAMNIFDLNGSQVTHVADVLAAAANSSAADVGQLGDALRQGGLVASQTGLTLEETTGALAAFADNALLGSDAGTSLKTMLQRLTPQSVEAKNLMEDLGFSAYDAQGNFIGLEGLAGELEDSLKDMTVEQRNSAMATLFGSDAVRGANVLYEEGAKGIAEYVSKVNDQGAAARMAAIQNDNLSGDLEALGGAFETALIENGSKANDTLRFLAQSATSAVAGFSSLPEIVQTTAVGLGGVTTAGLGVLGVVGTFGPKIKEAREALSGMGTAGDFLSRNLGKIAGGMAAVGAGVAVFTLWEATMASARAEGEKLAAEWRGLAFDTSEFGSGLDAFQANLAAVNDEFARMSAERDSSKAPWDADYRQELGAGIDELESIGNEMSRISDLAVDLAASFGISGDAALEFVLSQQSAGIDVLAEDYDSVSEALGTTLTQMTSGTEGAHKLADGMETLDSEVASVEEQVKAFSETLDALINQFYGIEAAQDAFQQGLNDLPEKLAEATGAGLSLNDVLISQTDEAIAVREHMRGMVDDAAALVAEWQEQGAEGEELATGIAMLSESFRDQAEAAGLPAPVVDHYLEVLAEIPVSKPTNIHASVTGVDEGIRRLNDLARAASNVGIMMAAAAVPRVEVLSRVGSEAGGPVTLTGMARPGPTDIIPAMLAPGEYVLRADAVRKIGLPTLDAMNAGQVGGMFHGGSVSRTVVAPAGGGAGGYNGPSSIVVPVSIGGRNLDTVIVDGLDRYVQSNGAIPVRTRAA